MDLVIGIDELREDLSIISQVVNQKLECFSITIKEYLLINFLEFVQAIKHFLKCGAWNESQDISLGHHVVCSADIKGNDLTVQLNHSSDLSLVLLPLLSLLLDLSLLGIKLILHLQVESL